MSMRGWLSSLVCSLSSLIVVILVSLSTLLRDQFARNNHLLCVILIVRYNGSPNLKPTYTFFREASLNEQLSEGKHLSKILCTIQMWKQSVQTLCDVTTIATQELRWERWKKTLGNRTEDLALRPSFIQHTKMWLIIDGPIPRTHAD